MENIVQLSVVRMLLIAARLSGVNNKERLSWKKPVTTIMTIVVLVVDGLHVLQVEGTSATLHYNIKTVMRSTFR